VLELLRDGLSYQEVGRSLAMAERTARAHVAAIKEKLAAATAAQCVARGYELGLLRPRSGSAS
jgi:DNA-binding NarL/FixJ family response regulator